MKLFFSDPQTMYIRQWAESLPGVTVIALDYSLSPEATFPAALQDTLDFYQWLSCGDNFTQVLGFQPEEIIISGESSGANLAIGLILLLNDIRREHPNEASRMPHSVVNIFPRISLRAETFASSWLAPFETLVNNGMLLAVAKSYIPKTSTDANGNLNEFDATCNDNGKAWFLRKDVNLVDSPYLTAFSYKHFEELSDVRLHMLGFNFCPFLDEGLRLVRIWKGGKRLEILDSFHAAISFAPMSPECRGVSKQCAKFIAKAFKT